MDATIYTLPEIPSLTLETVRPVPVLVPNLPTANELLPYLLRIDAAHHYSNYGPLWHEFRDGFAAYLSCRAGGGDVRVAPTSSGTTAIELALRARAIPGRRYCLMPSYTFIASAHAVCNAGLEPFLLDVEETSLVLTPWIAAAALASLPEPPAAGTRHQCLWRTARYSRLGELRSRIWRARSVRCRRCRYLIAIHRPAADLRQLTRDQGIWDRRGRRSHFNRSLA